MLIDDKSLTVAFRKWYMSIKILNTNVFLGLETFY